MLVVVRKINESICIGDDILITLVDIRGDKARLGITAPREVTVNRSEIHNVIKRSEVVARDGEQS